MFASTGVGRRSLAQKTISLIGWPLVLAAAIVTLIATLLFVASGCSGPAPIPVPLPAPSTPPPFLPAPESLATEDSPSGPAAPQAQQTQAGESAPTSEALAPSPDPSSATIEVDWDQIGLGLELRTQLLRPRPDGPEVRLITLRVSPEHHVFDVAYRPGQPLDLESWQVRTGAPIVLNGGYFTEEFVATGLVVADGQTYGSSYGEFAGMFAVTAAGPEIRWLQQRPYDAAEPLGAALQAFPMLVLPGGILGFDEAGGETARRTVIGQDTSGRLLLILAPDGGFTLSELSSTLVNSDLALDTALNLDGGTSTGLSIKDPPLRVDSFGLLPTVITIRPR